MKRKYVHLVVAHLNGGMFFHSSHSNKRKAERVAEVLNENPERLYDYHTTQLEDWSDLVTIDDDDNIYTKRATVKFVTDGDSGIPPMCDLNIEKNIIDEDSYLCTSDGCFIELQEYVPHGVNMQDLFYEDKKYNNKILNIRENIESIYEDSLDDFDRFLEDYDLSFPMMTLYDNEY